MESPSVINFNYWFLQTIALLVTAVLIPRLKVSGPLAALSAVVALGFVNSHIWDAALFLSLPDSLTLHALIVFFSNGIIFWIFVKIMPGIEVEGLLPALAAPLVFSIVSILLYNYAREIDWINLGKSVINEVQIYRDELKKGETESE